MQITVSCVIMAGASTYQVGPKQGNDKRDKDTHQLGQNEHEHETQSCQLENNVIDQENRSDQKLNPQ